MHSQIVNFIAQNVERLDKIIFFELKKYSRSLIKKWIINKKIKINNNTIVKPSTKVFKNDKILINIEIEKKNKYEAQNIKLNHIYEDNDILIINKHNNIIVHPGAGNTKNTILNALIYFYPDSINLPRAGIVHRLDKNTTGLMVIAKNINSYLTLIKQFKQQKIKREYEAVVFGVIQKNGTIIQPIMRHPKKRIKMMVHNNGKKAITHFKVLKNFNNCTHIRLKLETGRTHQIRVHMSYIKHFIIGDKLYSPKNRKNILLIKELENFHRQALHAVKLSIQHPENKKIMHFHSSLPEDIKKLIFYLEKNNNTVKNTKNNIF